jgi:hypothetical protein
MARRYAHTYTVATEPLQRAQRNTSLKGRRLRRSPRPQGPTLLLRPSNTPAFLPASKLLRWGISCAKVAGRGERACDEWGMIDGGGVRACLVRVSRRDPIAGLPDEGVLRHTDGDRAHLPGVVQAPAWFTRTPARPAASSASRRSASREDNRAISVAMKTGSSSSSTPVMGGAGAAGSVG